jgi:outer membrane immunogenic protein
MTGMKQAAGAAALVVALAITASPASADPPGQFGGGYLGANAGIAWGSSNYSTDPGCQPTSFVTFCDSSGASSANGTAVANSGAGSLSSTGFTGGVQGGYNWQVGNIVFGGEGDFGALDLSKSVTATGDFPVAFLGTNYTLSDKVSAEWLLTLRGRLGLLATSQLLLYGTAGIAFTDLKVTSSYADNAIDASFPGGTGYGSRSDLRVGWTIGGGGELLLAEGWSLKGEYLYVDFGSLSVAVPASNTPDYPELMGFKADLSAQIARIGLNYFLN